MTVVFALALAAALLLGSGVASQHEARRVDPEQMLRADLRVGLVGRPRWLTGLVGDVSGWAALTAWALAVAQPLITLAAGLVWLARTSARPDPLAGLLTDASS